MNHASRRIWIVLATVALAGCAQRSGDSPPRDPPAAPPPTLADASFLVAARPERWTLAWNDEFEGQQLDAAKWAIGLPWRGTDGSDRHHNNEYASYIADDDVSVRDGALQLTTQRRDVTGLNGRVFRYTQGLITTSKSFRQAYGYFEVRVKIPIEAGPGLWPAFWTLAEGWPPEMDIAEFWTSTNRSHQGLAYRGPSGGVRWDDHNTHLPLPTSWATFGMEWGPGYQVYNTNGKATHRVHGAHVPAMPHYLLLNSGVESGRPPTAGTIFPNTFAVDYVRVYARPAGPGLLNASFDSGEIWPWTTYGRSVIVGYGARSAGHCVRVDGALSGAEQHVFGLKPDTRYTLSASVRAGGGTVALGVKAHGTAEARVEVDGKNWSRPEITFKTGPQATSATIYCFAEKADSWGFFDDVEIVEAR